MITLQRLKEMLSYDSLTGEFVRRTGIRGHAAGSKVGYQREDGRVCIIFDGGRYLRSRLAWFYTHGEWPADEIDHINGSYSDDRIVNLREATRHQNRCNSRMRSDNKSGYKGVHWSKKDRVWVASIYLNGKCKYLGGFLSAKRAHSEYSSAAKKYYREFARVE